MCVEVSVMLSEARAQQVRNACDTIRSQALARARINNFRSQALARARERSEQNMQIINKIWYEKNKLKYVLFPFSLIYRFIISIRHFLYQKNIFKSYKINVPIIVVGNITVGGTGKTPLVIALINELQKKGFQPGVILRGYRGKSKVWPLFVDKNSDPNLVGDEAVLIAKNTGVPVVVGQKRVDDARMIASRCNIILSDDGLQHYALQRDIEMVVVDGMRGLGNGFCLPAGPLREPASRLNSIDFIITNSDSNKNSTNFTMQFILDKIVSIADETKTRTFSELKNKKIIAVAGIGNPDRFFQSLELHELIFTKKIFPDHYVFQKSDFDNMNADIILMTEKDAVKCRNFSDARFYFVSLLFSLSSFSSQSNLII